jgi:hypothetical protein
MPVSPPDSPAHDSSSRSLPSRSRLRLAARLLAILILALLLAAGLTEGFARLRFLPSIGSVLEHEPYKKLILNQAPRGIAVPTAFTTNRWGMRGGEPPRDWSRWETWIAIGSSTTLCYHLDDKKTWPYLLQVMLQRENPRTWIGNAGQDGVTTRASSYFMEKVVSRVRPDAVLFMAGGSDMALSFSDDRRENSCPYDHAFEKRIDREMDKSSVRERSRLYRAYKLRQRRLLSATVILEQPLHKSRFPAPLAAPEDTVSADSLLANPLESFRRNILRIHAQGRKTGTRILFLTNPYLFGTDSAWAGLEARTLEYRQRDYHISAATEAGLLDRFNRELLGLCSANRMECLDLAPLIPKDSLHFYDEAHFTELGAAVAAEKIAAHILGNPTGK